jgi:hypothetical protein
VFGADGQPVRVQPQTTLSATQIDRSAGPVGYTSRLDPATGTYSVVNADTGQAVTTGLTEQQAQLQAQEQGFFDEGIPVPANTELQGPPLALAQNLTPEQLNQIAAGAGVDAGDVDISDVVVSPEQWLRDISDARLHRYPDADGCNDEDELEADGEHADEVYTEYCMLLCSTFYSI